MASLWGDYSKGNSAQAKRTSPVRYLVVLLCTLAVISSVFLYLNSHFNKYTAPGAQPINGIIYLNEVELNTVPLHHLINGWEFYPQQLLEPNDLSNEAVESSRRYLSIGSHNTFALGDISSSGHGSGTYALTLMLPETPAIYSLTLPEVYSSYRLYLNGHLLNSEGNPQQNAYQDATRSRILTFNASGKTTLLIATTNYNSLYDGLIFPPAFGKAEAIYQLETTRTTLSSLFIFILATSLIWTALTAFYSKKNRLVGIYLSLIALFGLLQVSHYNLHHFFTLPVQPWQTLEVLSLYLIITLVVAVHNNICSISKRVSFYSSTICLGFLLTIVLFYFFALSGNSPAALALSYLTTLYKVSASLYVIIVSVFARRFLPYSMLLFIVDVIFAASLLWDRVFPQFEPIFGGWYAEQGIIVFCLGSIACIMQDILRGYVSNVKAKIQITAMTRQLEIQKDYLSYIEEKEHTIKTLRHDFRQHTRVLSELSREHNYQDLDNYLAQIGELSTKNELQRLTANNELNALLQYYGLRARSQNIAFDCDISLPKDLGKHTVNISIILGNALENALDAAAEYAQKCDTPHHGPATELHDASSNPSAFVSVQASTKAHQALYVIENTFYELNINEQGKFVSTKHPEEGIGVESIKATVAELGGYCSFNYEEEHHIFKLMISLPLVEDATHGKKN